MRTKNLVVALVVSSILAGAAVWLGTGEALSFSQDNYYVFPLGGTSVDVESLSLAAQAEGYVVVRYDGNSVAAYAGDQISIEPVDALLASDQLLVVDGGRFLLRVAGEAFTYAVRPSSLGLELVLSPHEAQTMEGVFSVLVALEQLGVIGTEADFGFFETFQRDALKGPPAPAGARIESDLFGLTVAEDWHAFAAAKGLSLVGLRVEAVVELLPGNSIPAEYADYVTSESESLVRLLLPIGQLVSLATSESVGLVRQAYQPTAP